jgi:hypothetical protein
MSKGSDRRKEQISDQEMQKRWDEIFNSPYKKNWKKTKGKKVDLGAKRNNESI